MNEYSNEPIMLRVLYELMGFSPQQVMYSIYLQLMLMIGVAIRKMNKGGGDFT